MSAPLRPPVGNSGNDFEPHPPGAFLAVCADVYIEVQKNKYFNTVKDNGKKDTEETVTKVVIVFLTEHLIDIQGEMKPAYMSVWNRFSWGTADYPSNLFKLVKGWYPQADTQRILDMDISKLVGQGAYLSIVHNTKGDKVYANVQNVSPAPKGAPIPTIPADFKTHEQKMARTDTPAQSASAPPPAPATYQAPAQATPVTAAPTTTYQPQAAAQVQQPYQAPAPYAPPANTPGPTYQAPQAGQPQTRATPSPAQSDMDDLPF